MLARVLLLLTVSACQTPFTDGPTLVVRALDSMGEPVTNSPLDVTVWHKSRGGYHGNSEEVETDAGGYFEVGLRGALRLGWKRYLEVYGHVDPQSDRVQGTLNLTRYFPFWKAHVGDVRLFTPTDEMRWRRLSDAGLGRAWLEVRLIGGLREKESLLAEMGRRGGARWTSFLQARFEEETSDQPWGWFSGGLAAFRAWRIARGAADPLELQVHEIDGPAVAYSFPALPTVDFALVNRDPEYALELTGGGSYRSGRFARIQVELSTEAGDRIPPLEMDASLGGGMFSSLSLRPGEKTPARDIRFADYCQQPPPGRYTARILYHDSCDIDTDRQARAYMVVESEPIEFEIHPGVARVRRADHERYRQAIREIDTSRRVVLTYSTWHRGLVFDDVPLRPEDVLFRAGWDALPALFEALDDPSIDLDRADWIVALCFNITGLLSPRVKKNALEFGRRRWVDRWPGSNGEPVPGPGGTRGAEHDLSDASRRAYHDRWRALRSGIRLETYD